jgi:hypothetical protein
MWYEYDLRAFKNRIKKLNISNSHKESINSVREKRIEIKEYLESL